MPEFGYSSEVITIKRFFNFLDAINDFLIRIIKGLLAIMLSVQILLIFITAVMRYCFNHAIPWTDELTTYLLVAITFLGGYVASNMGALAKVELVSGTFKGALGKAVQVVARILSGGLVGWIAFYGTQLYFSPVIQNQTSSALRMPVKYVWWCLPVAMWLLLFTELLGIFHIFVPREGQTESAVASDTDSE